MFRLNDLVTSLAVCFLLTSGCGVLSVHAGPDNDPSTSPEDSSDREAQDSSTDPAAHHSDVLSMLGALKGGNELKNVESLLHGLSLMKTAFNSLLNLSPLFQRTFAKAAKENPSLRVVLKASKGQFPDLKDVYDLTFHSRKKDILSDLTKVELNSPPFVELFKLLNHPATTVQSASALTKVVKLWTGNDVNFNQNVLVAVENGTIEVTKENLAQVNMIYLLEFILDSSANLQTLMKLIPEQSPSMLKNVLKMLSEIDVSKLSKIKVLQQVDNDKYKVTDGKASFLPDPDATRFLNDFAKAKKLSKERDVDNSKVISLSTDLLKGFTSLVTRLLHDASTGTTSIQSNQVSMG